MADETGGNPSYHKAQGLEYSNLPGLRKTALVYQGSYANLKTLAEKVKIGVQFTGESDKFWISSCHLSRRPGKRGEMTLEYSELTNVDWWSLDWEEIRKDVETWKPAEKDAKACDRALIATWKTWCSSHPSALTTYIYNDKDEALTDTTLKVAKMITQGILFYTAHAPVITRNSLSNGYPKDCGKNLDKQETPAETSEWTMAGSLDVSLSDITSLKPFWVKTSDRAYPNSDGTYSRVEQWTGMDSVNEDLYPSASTAAT